MDASLEHALHGHLDAIRARDLDALRATLSDHLTLVTAQGEVIVGRERFLELHDEWFGSETWRIETEVRAVHVGSDLALCVLDLRYFDDAEAAPTTSVLSLAFERHGDRWLLVFDQNTPTTAR